MPRPSRQLLLLISALFVLIASAVSWSAQVVVWTTGHRSEVTRYLNEQLAPRAHRERRISVVVENVRMNAETRGATGNRRWPRCADRFADKYRGDGKSQSAR